MRNPSWGPRNKQPLSALAVSGSVFTQGGAMTATATYSYTKIAAKLVNVRASVVITATGTGTGVIDINVPFLPAETTPGASVNVTSTIGLACQVFDNGGQGQIRIYKPDGTTAIAVATLLASVTYRIA
jgi:hypothetical protein